MAEFNIVIRKKQDNPLISDRYTVNDKYTNQTKPSLVFFDEETDSYEEMNASKSFSSRRYNPENKVESSISSDWTSCSKSEINPKYCPICFELLEDRIKRIYSKRMEGKVYFPFLDFSTAIRTKVKVCYRCYKHLVSQWKDYNKSEIPHKERIYKDRNGSFIPSSVEENKARYNKLFGIKDDDEVLTEEHREEFQVSADESSKEIFHVPHRKLQRPKTTSNSFDNNFQQMLDTIHEHIGRIEVTTNMNLKKTKRELEKVIEQHSYQVQEELNELRNDNVYVQHQVTFMRQQLLDIQKESRSPRLKRKKRKPVGHDTINTATAVQKNNKPFYVG